MSVLSQILSYRLTQDQQKAADEHSRRATTANILLDAAKDPNRTQDEQAAIYQQIDSLLSGGKKSSSKAAGNPLQMLMGAILHHDHEKEGSGQAGDIGQGGPFSGQDPNNPVIMHHGPMGDLSEMMKQRNDKRLNPSIDVGTDPYGAGLQITQGRRHGELTNAEIEDRRKLDLYGQEQGILGERQQALQKVRNEAALSAAQIRAEGQKVIAGMNNEARQHRLDDQQMFQLGKETDALTQNYIALGLDPIEAAKKANQDSVDKLHSLIEQRKAQTNLTNVTAKLAYPKFELQKRGVENQELRTQIYEMKSQADVDKLYSDIGEGMSAGTKRIYDTQAAPWLIIMRDAVATREALEKDIVESRVTNEQATPKIAEANQRAEDAAKKLQEIRDGLTASTVPRRSQRGGSAKIPARNRERVQELINQ